MVETTSVATVPMSEEEHENIRFASGLEFAVVSTEL